MDDIQQTFVKIAGAAVIFLVLFFVFWPFVSIDQYERGVITRFGQIERTADPGLNFKMPIIESVHIYPINIQSLSIDNVETYTIDNQELTAKLNVNYQIAATGITNIYTNVPDYAARLQTMVIDRFKSALGKMNVVEVTSKRADIAMAIFHNIKDEAKRLYGLEIVDFQIVNIDYTPQFRQATEQAMTAKAGVEKREQEKRQAEVEADKAKIEAAGKANARIEAARGEAASTLAIAQAEAQSIELKGMANAKAMKAQADAIKGSPELVEMKKAERWDGSLPEQMLGGTIPLMNIGGK